VELATVTEFIAKGTVTIGAYNYDEDGDLADPGATIRVIVKDKDGVQKAGYISVSNNTSFTAGWAVTGGTSGATGFIISTPSGNRLELARCTGVWVAGETIASADGIGTSLTSSALVGADMTIYLINSDEQTGIYYYLFRTTTSSTKCRYQVEVEVIDGSGATAVSSIGTFAFKVK